jgi:uncharacterized coiled-coil protein SlyX
MDLPALKRLEAMEEQITHLDRLVEQLNQIVIEQGRALHRLQQQQQAISQTVENIELDRIKGAPTKPPHYQ